jgi:hypothetical protein
VVCLDFTFLKTFFLLILLVANAQYVELRQFEGACTAPVQGYEFFFVGSCLNSTITATNTSIKFSVNATYYTEIDYNDGLCTNVNSTTYYPIGTCGFEQGINTTATASTNTFPTGLSGNVTVQSNSGNCNGANSPLLVVVTPNTCIIEFGISVRTTCNSTYSTTEFFSNLNCQGAPVEVQYLPIGCANNGVTLSCVRMFHTLASLMPLSNH